MSQCEILIFLLLAMLAFQQCFYMYHIQKLVNKLMSRNFFEYIQGEVQNKIEKKSPDKKNDSQDEDSSGDLNSLNAMLR